MSRFSGPLLIAEWANVYAAMTALLDKDFVTRGVLNSYAGIIVDEYQDCTLPMHALIARLNALLPCRVLGDELQGIFDFNSEALVGWTDVRTEFLHDLGALDIPHRWIKAENRGLGQWLLDNRDAFRDGREPDYTASPVNRRSISYRALAGELIRLTHAKEGSICIIRPKARNLHSGLESSLVGHGYQVLEANDLGDLRKLILAFSDGTPEAKRNAAFAFLKRVHSGLTLDDQNFIRRILVGDNQRPRRADRRELCVRHAEGVTPHLLRDLIGYCDALAGVHCKLRESVSALRCILEEHCETAVDLKTFYATEIARRRFHSRSHFHRTIGSTLLVKGLEYDHAVILRGPNWQASWGGYRDLYVALSRGSKSATLIEMTA